jgi:peptide/nickel transport system substrate-binding protein
VTVGAAAVVLSLAMTTAALGGRAGSGSAQSSAAKPQLRYAEAYATTNNNPAIFPNGGGAVIANMSYDSLVYQTSTGKMVPQLATSWGYTGKAQRNFVITLRKGVRFSNGERLTAQALKQYLLYFQKAKGSWANLATFDKVTIKGPLTVSLHLTLPNPLMVQAISQRRGMGDVVCPAFLKDPDKLTSQTCGAGPYMLDTSQTVPQDHYLLKANPYYWNKAAVHYSSILVKVISNPSSLLQAMQTGQQDVGDGDGTTYAAARSAGLHATTAPEFFFGVHFQDLKGTMVPALADARVRQALNYAVDRNAITHVLFPTAGLGSPTNQFWFSGQDGYVPSLAKVYPYDPAKAKQLLAAAGYSKGFAIDVLSTPVDQIDTVTQAVASYWKAVGVTLNIHSVDVTEYSNGTHSGQYPAYTIEWAPAPVYIDWGAIFSPNSTTGRNPQHIADSALSALFKRAQSSQPAVAGPLWQQFGKRLSDLAWFVPITATGPIYYTRSNVAGLTSTSARPLIDLRDARPVGK